MVVTSGTLLEVLERFLEPLAIVVVGVDIGALVSGLLQRLLSHAHHCFPPEVEGLAVRGASVSRRHH